MTRLKLFASTGLAVLVFIAMTSGTAEAKKKKHGSDDAGASAADRNATVDELNNRIIALESLDAYHFSKQQLGELAKTCEGIEAVAPTASKPLSSPKADQYHEALLKLCTALEKGDADEASLNTLKSSVDSLAEEVGYQYPAPGEPTEALRKAALQWAAKLDARQIASSTQLYAEHVTGPAELLVGAAEGKKSAKDANEWTALRDSAANEAAYLVAGWDGVAAKPVAERAIAWLDQCPDLEAAATDAQRASLQAGARQVGGPVDAWVVLHHWVDRDVARVLSNPMLPTAIELRLKTTP